MLHSLILYGIGQTAPRWMDKYGLITDPDE